MTLIFLALDYDKTATYYWPLIGNFKYSSVVGAEGDTKLENYNVKGPFGFGEALQLKENAVKMPLPTTDFCIHLAKNPFLQIYAICNKVCYAPFSHPALFF